jgi:hypothetical protein
MKHPFLTLYYTGIGIFLSIGVILTLVVINVSNITQAFTKETPVPKPYPESTDVKVLRNLPVEKETEFVITKPKQLKNESKPNEEVVSKPTPQEKPSNDSLLNPKNDSVPKPPLKP